MNTNKREFQLTTTPLILSAILSLLLAVFSFFLLAYPPEARGAEKVELEKKPDAQEAPVIPVWPRDHLLPSRTCKIVKSADENQTTISDQVIEEFYNAEKRKIIADRLFRCQTAYASYLGGFCGSPYKKDITSTIRELIPRVFYEPSSSDVKTYDEFILRTDGWDTEKKEKYNHDPLDFSKKNMLALFSDRFDFESGIPNELDDYYKMEIPKVSPPIDEVQCGYCRAENGLKPMHGPSEFLTLDEGHYLVHYRICFLLRKEKLYDISANVISRYVEARSNGSE